MAVATTQQAPRSSFELHHQKEQRIRSPLRKLGNIFSNTPGQKTANGAASANPDPQRPSGAASLEEASPKSAAERIADIHSQWKSQTPIEKAKWMQETFGSPEPPWSGEVAYYNGEDIEYEEKIAAGSKLEGTRLDGEATE